MDPQTREGHSSELAHRRVAGDKPEAPAGMKTGGSGAMFNTGAACARRLAAQVRRSALRERAREAPAF